MGSTLRLLARPLVLCIKTLRQIEIDIALYIAGRPGSWYSGSSDDALPRELRRVLFVKIERVHHGS